MASREASIPLIGSERGPLPGARPSGRLDPKERILVTVILRPSSGARKASAVAAIARQRPQDRTYLTREQLASRFGASSSDLALVEAFAREYALDVVEQSSAKRSVILAGTIAQFSQAFGVKVARFRHPRGIFRL